MKANFSAFFSDKITFCAPICIVIKANLTLNKIVDIRVCIFRHRHTRTHFSNSTGFHLEWFVRMRRLVVEIINGIHFRRLYDYGIGIVYLFLFGCSFLYEVKLALSLSLCIRNAKERGEMLNELLSTRHIYTIKQRWTPKPIDYLYTFRPIYKQRSRLCLCVRPFLSSLWLLFSAQSLLQHRA